MNLAGKPPLGIKDRSEGRDPAHLARVRALPCCICSAWGLAQTTPTEAHHTIHGRHSQRRTPDRMAIPLCSHHHRGGPGVIGLHSNPSAWRRLFGDDTAWIPGTLDKLESEA
jgi:hypothetical protein